MNKKEEKYIIIGTAVFFLILFLIIIGIIIYFLFIRKSTSDTPQVYTLRTAPDNYISSIEDKLNLLGTNTPNFNAISSPTGNYVLFLNEMGNISILKKHESGVHHYTVSSVLYQTTGQITQPLTLSVLSRPTDDSTLISSYKVVAKLITGGTSPLTYLSSPRDTSLGADDNNFALYVNDKGEARIRVFSGDTFDPASVITSTDFKINSFRQ